jgi:hypothetical protein
MTRLLPGVGDGQAQVPGLVLGVQSVAGGRGDKAGRTLLADRARPQALGGLLDELVLQEPFGEEGPDDVVLEVAAYAGGLGKYEVPVPERFVGVEEHAFAHGGQEAERRSWKEARHLLD